MSNMLALQTCIVVAIEKPSHIERGLPDKETEVPQRRMIKTDEAVAEAITMFKEGVETKNFGKKFTKAAISAILLLCYNLKLSWNKDPMIKTLHEAYEKDTLKLEMPVGIQSSSEN